MVVDVVVNNTCCLLWLNFVDFVVSNFTIY